MSPTVHARRRGRAIMLAASALAASLAGCSTGSAAADPTPPPDLVLTSPDLDTTGALPAWATGQYGDICAGENRSPALAWTGAPEGTRSFVVTFTDPAHPSYVHWVVTGIDPSAEGLDAADDGLVDDGVVGVSFRGPGTYGGPCVEGNTYIYRVYALDEEITGTATTTEIDVLGLMDGHILDEAELEVHRAQS
jgi:Raf kinase inhibitor-like YbhB/YbcL family protein